VDGLRYEQDELPPMKDEPNQAETDRRQAEELRRGAAAQKAEKK